MAADGSNSRIRSQYAAAFAPSIELRSNKYIWLGTDKAFEAFTFIFEETEHGWIWAHAYRFDADDLDLHRRVRRSRPGGRSASRR